MSPEKARWVISPNKNSNGHHVSKLGIREKDEPVARQGKHITNWIYNGKEIHALWDLLSCVSL